MIVGIKDAVKQFIISIMAGCAVFICTLFLNYSIDITNIESQIVGEQAQSFYEAQKLAAVAVSTTSGSCLLLTTAIMLAFFIKNYIDAHKKELGILKTLGYPNFKIAKSFWVFGLSVFIGAAVGFVSSFLVMGKFYEVQNESGFLPDFSVSFHPGLMVALVLAPAALFALVSILYAAHKLRTPALKLITDNISEAKRAKRQKTAKSSSPFVDSLRKGTITNHKA